MKEIEIKAHVQNPEETAARLDSIAEKEANVIRDDTYYKYNGKSIRIRKENSDSIIKYLLTYKRKELRTDSSGKKSEVNDEFETSIENPEILELFLLDSGAEISLKKHKEVTVWKKNTDGPDGTKLEAHFELCKIEKLGWFLEIEIVTPIEEDDKITKIREKLYSLLAEAGLDESMIENRYYSEMLKNGE